MDGIGMKPQLKWKVLQRNKSSTSSRKWIEQSLEGNARSWWSDHVRIVYLCRYRGMPRIHGCWRCTKVVVEFGKYRIVVLHRWRGRREGGRLRDLWARHSLFPGCSMCTQSCVMISKSKRHIIRAVYGVQVCLRLHLVHDNDMFMHEITVVIVV